MILRGTVLAHDRIGLHLAHPERELPVEAKIAPVCAADVFPPPPPPSVTFDDIAQWLAEQDIHTRGRCAELLSAEISQTHAAAHALGLSQGEAAGLREAQLKTDAALSALGQLTASAETVFEQEASQLTALCADIVAEAFLKIAGPKLVSREAVVGAVKEVLRRVKEERELTIRVNGADLPCLQQHESAFAQMLGGRKFVLLADTRVTAGGCIVESKLGSLDGRLEVQLQQLFETLRAAKIAHGEPA